MDSHDRLTAVDRALTLYHDTDADATELLQAAEAIGKYIQNGTVPSVDIVIHRTDDGIQVRINGDVRAEIDHDQAGHAGVDAVYHAAYSVAQVLGVEPTYIGPGESA